jgi:ADP-heptose:LPS heptosyltransferase
VTAGGTGGPADDRPLLVVLRALGLGDLLTGVPALRALADAFPDHRRVLAAPAWLAPLGGATGAVDAVVDTAPLAPLAPPLHRADVAVNLHGRGPESHGVLLDAAPGRLVAFAHPEVPASWGQPAWEPGEHEVARWCRLLDESGIPSDPSRLDLHPPAATVPGWTVGATLIHPGGKDAAKRWPAERWSAVARAERERGRAVVITGSGSERGLGLEVARRAGLPPTAVLAGRTDLRQLAGLVAAAGRVACGDTGVAHLATALRTPSVVLFGPFPPAEWGPPPQRRWHRAVWAGRRDDPGAGRAGPGLLAIETATVVGELGALPERADLAGA